jgi:hypothetical protein
MHAMNPKSRLSKRIYPINFEIPWEKLFEQGDNTGLGVENPDNPSWDIEAKTFQREFKLLIENYDNIKKIRNFYDEGDLRAELRVCDCAQIMKILQPKNKRKYIDDDEFYEQYLIKALKKACPKVFAENSTSDQYTETYQKDSAGEVKSGYNLSIDIDGDILSEKNLVQEEAKSDKEETNFGISEETETTSEVGEISQSRSLFEHDSIEENKKSSKAHEMRLSEMIERGIVSVGDTVYVKNHMTDEGVLQGGDTISYKGKEYSLNRYVTEVLGPGSRNAYTLVIHKQTGKLLKELRGNAEKNLVQEEAKSDKEETNFGTSEETETTSEVGEISQPCSLFEHAPIGENKKSSKTTRMKLSEMIERGIVSVGDTVYVKNRMTDEGVLQGGDIISYKGKEYSLNQYVAEVLGPPTARNAYIYVIHKQTGKLLDKLREDAEK